MGNIILVTGGGRSGKSAWARERAEALPGPRAFIATCPPIDDEMRERIERHRREREGAEWTTIETQVGLAEALRGAAAFDVVLVDCLTLWLNNEMYEAEKAGRGFTEDDAAIKSADALDACRALSSTLLFVTNEIGSGIIPADPATRRYRDIVGRCNRMFAAAAGEVVLLVSGIPMKIKP